jgi:thiamine biosynthesis lipoprotein
MISRPHRTAVLASVALAQALAACGDRGPVEYRLAGPSMGTQFTVTIVAGPDFTKERVQQQIHAALEDVDARMSTYRSQSEVARFNRQKSTNWVSVSPQLCRAVARSLEISVLTGGAFDITVGPLVNLWGFGPGESRREPPPAAAIDAAKSVTGFGKLHVDCEQPAIRKDSADLHIDLSAFAKGLAVDNIAGLLDEAGIENYLVNIGGDLRVRGHNAQQVAWRVAIEKPDGNGRTVETVIHVSGGAVATSGDYRNFFVSNGRRYSHTIDPGTGRPITHQLASATVHSVSAADADALATAIMVLGPDEGLEFAEREGIAAYLLIREGSEYAERISWSFKLLMER